LCLLDQPVASAPGRGASAPRSQGVLGAFVRGPERVVAGTPAAVRIAAHLATSRKGNGPWSGVAVGGEKAGKSRREMLWRGHTGGAGVADVRFRVPQGPDGKYSIEVVAHAGPKSDRATHELELGSGGKVLLESDKPMYQPGQTIHLRAVSVRPQDGRP